MCLPWTAEGLDLKPTRMINESLVLKHKYFSNGRSSLNYFKSSVWSSIKMHVRTVNSNSVWVVVTSENINLWSDNWLGELRVDLLQIDPVHHAKFYGTVADVIVADGISLTACCPT